MCYFQTNTKPSTNDKTRQYSISVVILQKCISKMRHTCIKLFKLFFKYACPSERVKFCLFFCHCNLSCVHHFAAWLLKSTLIILKYNIKNLIQDIRRYQVKTTNPSPCWKMSSGSNVKDRNHLQHVRTLKNKY